MGSNMCLCCRCETVMSHYRQLLKLCGGLAEVTFGAHDVVPAETVYSEFCPVLLKTHGRALKSVALFDALM